MCYKKLSQKTQITFFIIQYLNLFCKSEFPNHPLDPQPEIFASKGIYKKIK